MLLVLGQRPQSVCLGEGLCARMVVRPISAPLSLITKVRMDVLSEYPDEAQ